jgi:hypothetical protein
LGNVLNKWNHHLKKDTDLYLENMYPAAAEKEDQKYTNTKYYEPLYRIYTGCTEYLSLSLTLP